MSALRRRVYEIIELAREGDGVSRLVDLGLVILILLNVAAFVLETVPEFEVAYRSQLYWFELFSVAVFTIEYTARIWSCVEMPFLNMRAPWLSRLKYATKPYLLIDLLAILPFYLSFVVPIDLRVLRVFRLFRILKLARYSPTMHILLRVLAHERRTLVGTFLLAMTLLLFVATSAYYAERIAQPEKFGTIPDAAWWAIATLTTVGYGDVAPITPLGKIIGGMAMICGIIVLALPIAVIATGFSNEIGKRDFVVSWPVISRVPSLACLRDDEIDAVTPFLAAQFMDPYREVIAPEDRADAMFFVVRGSVRLRTNAGETVFRVGDFFGELAMLEGRSHTHSYRTTEPTRLLRLAKDDFEFLSESHPAIAHQIMSVARKRRTAREAGEADPAAGTSTPAADHSA
ncbi:MAG TPA: cyclic nucleotide-gated ion channel [Hyphomicrobiaceae bacterium]|nr:cyclic nucleotide-gated ion channel [Hyphomicrobiaceae bacterium]